MAGMKPGMTRSEEMFHKGVGSTGSAMIGAGIDAVAWGAIIPILYIIASVGLSLATLASFSQSSSLAFANLLGGQEAVDFTKSLFEGFKTHFVDGLWDTISSLFESLTNGIKSFLGFGSSSTPPSSGEAGSLDTSAVFKLASSTVAALVPRVEGRKRKIVVRVDASPLARIMRAVRERVR